MKRIIKIVNILFMLLLINESAFGQLSYAEGGPAVESYDDRFTTACGRDALEALLETSGRNA